MVGFFVTGRPANQWNQSRAVTRVTLKKTTLSRFHHHFPLPTAENLKFKSPFLSMSQMSQCHTNQID